MKWNLRRIRRQLESLEAQRMGGHLTEKEQAEYQRLLDIELELLGARDQEESAAGNGNGRTD